MHSFIVAALGWQTVILIMTFTTLCSTDAPAAAVIALIKQLVFRVQRML